MPTLESVQEDRHISRCLGNKDAADCYSMAAMYRERYEETGNGQDLALSEAWFDSGRELQEKGR
jgi:hypothetical protein